MARMMDIAAADTAIRAERDAGAGGDGLSLCGAIARRSDPDRFFCALFLPEPVREDAFSVIAFNHESVRALTGMQSWSVAGPMAGLIRLQWWREIIEGAPHPHEVAPGLRVALARAPALRRTLLRILDAREAEAEGLTDWPSWRAAMRGGAGGVQVAIAQRAGLGDPVALQRIEALGAAYGAGGLLRHLDIVLAAGRCPLPDTALQAIGLSREALRNGAPPGLLDPLRVRLREEGRAFLAQALPVRLRRDSRAAALPGVLARRDLARPDGRRAAGRGLGDRLAVMAAMLSGRI